MGLDRPPFAADRPGGRQRPPRPLAGRTAAHRRLLLALVAVLLLAACGGSDPSTEAGTDGAASGGPGGEGDAAPADAGSVDRTASLTYGASYFGMSSDFDPHTVATGIANIYLFPVYDRLVHLSPEAEPVPGLATSWEFEEDGAVLSMELREGVTFHDGEPFDAAAVRANIERGQTLEGSTVSGELAEIDEVEVVDDHHVRLHLNGPAASLPLVLSDRAGAMISPAAMGSDLSTDPVGAGMYRLSEYQLGVRAVFTPHEGYWDPDAQLLGELVFVNVEDPVARENGIKTGAFDATEITASSAPDVEAAGATITAKSGLVYMNLYLNRTRSEFGDVRVRQALNHAIDRETIVASIAFGRGEVASQPFPQGYFAHSPDAEGMYPYDPERARELLAEAGLPDGFSFEVIVPTVDSYVQHAEALQSYFAEVGIDMSISQNADINEAFFVEQSRDARLSIWTGRPDPQMTTGLLYTSQGFSNAGRHSTPAVEELHQQALAAIDPAERRVLLQGLSEQIMVDALAVPIYFTEQVIAHDPDVVGLVPWTSGKTEFRGVGVTAG